MNYKLQVLQRQLAQQGVAVPNSSNSESGFSNRFMAAVEATIEAEADAAVKAAQAQQQRAETEVDKSREEVTKLHRELETTQLEARNRIDQMHTAMHQERERIDKAHALEVQQLQTKLAALQQQLANEQQDKVRAEMECKASKEMRVHMEATTKAVQAPAVQTIMPAAAPMKPLTMKVSQRDSNGRIVALSIAPTT